MADEIKPDLPEVAAPKNATIGDDNLEVREVEPDVTVDTVDAQVMAKGYEPVKTVQVHETHVQLDEIITDPSSPLAVQIPDAGRGSLDLPIHGLAGPRPEDVFAKDAASADDSDSDSSDAPKS